jgi:pimeloyl-ACP methyl ester carboxylesterase
MRVELWLACVLAALVMGCQSSHSADPARSQNVVFVVHGVDGEGPWYDGLINGLRRGDAGREVEMVSWGGSLMILPNLRMASWHDAGEVNLAEHIRAWQKRYPGGQVSLVGHSAGCGVILETVAKMDQGPGVANVVLLAPAVSPRYDLAPALRHVNGTLHVFFDKHDELLLRYGTAVAGTYDGVWGDSAGLRGFAGTDKLPAELVGRLQQHAYDRKWESLGNGGGHFGWRSERFVEAVLAPLVAGDAGPSSGGRAR